MRRIWLHGWASDQQIWSALPLGEHDHLITLQHGPAGFNAYCQAYWQQANTNEPVQLIAWSCGALVALQWLQQYPQLVERVILLNSTPCFMAQPDWPGISLQTLTDLQQRLEHNPPQAVKAFWWLLAQCERQPRQCLTQLQRYRLDLPWLQQALSWMMNVDLRWVAQHYAQRCYWIMGTQDPLLPATLHQQLPGTVQVLDTAHCPMLSQPAQLWQALRIGA